MIWHSSSLKELNEELQTNFEKGLSDAIANYRLKDFSENFSPTVSVTPFWQKLAQHLKQPMVLVLLIAAALFCGVELIMPAFDKHHLFISLGVIVFVLLFIVIKSIISFACEHIISREQRITTPKSVVIRGGVEKTIDSTQVVPGDIIVLRQRFSVPADARLIKTENLTCNESAVTGEYAPIVKDCDFICTDITPLTQRANMVYAGSWVSHGYGLAVVTETGDDTEFGKKIAIERKPALADIDNSLANLNKLLSQISGIISVILFIAIFLITRFSAVGNTLTLLSIAVHTLLISSAISLTLSPISISETSALITAIGLLRLKKNNVAVTNAEIIDEMGSVNCICVDKSAITIHNMTATEIYNGVDILDITGGVSNDTAMLLRLAAAASINDGDKTNKALIEACVKHTQLTNNEIDNLYPRLSYVPFDTDTMTTVSVNMIDGQPYAIVKGAAETVAQYCNGDTDHIIASSEAMGAKALHVVAVAVKLLSSVSDTVNPSKDELFGGLTFLGLIGFTDPIRDDINASVRECTEANIKVLLFTGDSLSTAKTIARQAGILIDDEQAILGSDLENMSEEEFLDAIINHTTFARVTPNLRIKIIQTLKAQNYVIAATGRTPSVNAAMDTANIGCALNTASSDAVKKTADVVLKDNSFKSIVTMIKGGKNIYENIRRSIASILTVNIGLVLFELFGYFIWQTSILNAMQMLIACLLINIISITLISFEPYSKLKDLVAKNVTKLNYDQKIDVAWQSVLFAIVTLITYAVCIAKGAAIANVGSLSVFAAASVIAVLGLRINDSILSSNILKNKACLITSLFLFILIFILAANKYDGLSDSLFIIITMSLIPLISIETGKIIKKYKRSK